MRILWIKTELLHPVDKGGKIRTYQMLRALARRHDVKYLCLDDGNRADDAEQLAKEYCSDLEVVRFSPPEKGSLRFYVALFWNLFSSLPYAIDRYRCDRFSHAISEHARTADLVVCDFLAPSINVSQLAAPVVLFQHNVEAMIWQRHASVPQHPFRRAYMSLQARRMSRFEASECRRFNRVIAVSEADAEVMKSKYGVTRVSHVGTGVDTGFFTRSANSASDGAPSKDIVFVGSMDWMPNDEGIRWFVSDVFPLVRARVSDASLTIVGRSPSSGLLSLASEVGGIRVTGSVPDVRPFLERAAMSVVPLRIGGGTRIKIYESMSMGTPVVSTTIGAEGLPLVPGVHIEIADDPAAMAEAITRVFGNPEHSMSMAAAAESFVRTYCGWDAVTEEFISQCLPREAGQA